MDPETADHPPDHTTGLGGSRAGWTVTLGLTFVVAYALDGGLALILLVIFAVMGWRYCSQIPASQKGAKVDTLQDLCAALVACAVGGAIWIAAFIFGIAINATPFLYPVGDEVYPFATAYNIVSVVVAVLGGVLAWRLLSRPVPTAGSSG